MKNKRFIIIEEDAVVRNIIQRSIVEQDPSFSVATEESTDAGLDQIANQEFDVVIDRGSMFQRLGTVWFYARKATVDLNVLREELAKVQPTASGAGQLNKAYTEELEKLFQ